LVSELFNGTAILDEPHYLALESLAARALADDEPERAFALSDRRCRIDPVPQPHCYLLRAEASFRAGQPGYAIDDLVEVLDIAPDDLEANRRMLAWSTGRRQRAAARALLKCERNIDVLRHALRVLGEANDRPHAAITVLDDTIRGWVAWTQGASAEVSIRAGSDTISSLIEPDPFFALSSATIRAASFVLTRPRSSEPQLASIAIDGRVFHRVRMAGNQDHCYSAPSENAAADGDKTTVIIPIYADHKATRACIESLYGAIEPSPGIRVVLVDDATPDVKIKHYIAGLAGRPDTEILVNPTNLGFVGSINRALRHVPFGDVILLNSDTIVAPGFGDRLRLSARSAPDIGIVNPLTNNGEFCSFPVPHQSNQLESLEAITALDQLAAASSPAGDVVDLPSGIGFCLYVTRACLDAVGLLSESYQRGYLEDVDFCLRAREAGFRSVCAPSVYIGHAGSRSFRSEKRSLVARNLAVLDRKFPSYRAECAAFAAADPLRAARQAIERRQQLADKPWHVIVSGEGAVGDVVRGRAEQLIAAGQATLLVSIRPGRSGAVASLTDAGGGLPQNLAFDLSLAAELQALDDVLGTASLSAIEIADPARVPAEVLDLLLDGRAPYDILLADSGMILPPALAADLGEPELTRWQQRWRSIAEQAQRILAPCPMAEAFGALHFPGLTITRIDAGPADAAVAAAPRPPAGPIGILALRASAEEFNALLDLIRALHERKPGLGIIVVGRTLNDIAAMRWPGVFVTGTVHRPELRRVLTQYGVRSVIAGLGPPLFGHPLMQEVAQCGLPLAQFDWSMGGYQPAPGDLAFTPELAAHQIADRLVQWLESR